ncbi:MAG: monovalent cation/H+ antiporter subunit D family protein [Alphaproteobacteria bacterium]|nr:monovalent cation/H+ antiporter subunit D family protein [Alphaproteobacteria bacterium]
MTAETLVLVAVLLPFAGTAPIALLGRWPNLREAATLVTAALLFATVLQVHAAVAEGARPATGAFTLLPGLDLAFAVEPLGMLFALVASGLWIVNSIYSIGYMRANKEPRQTAFYVCFAVALGSAVGVAFSANLFTLFLFYEILTLSTYPLVAHKATPEAQAGGRTYLLLLLGTSIALLLPAIVWTYAIAGTLDFAPGGLLAGRIDGSAVGVLLALFMFGIGKAALMPFHRWLPAAMVAPTPVSALLHAVAVVKAGVFCVVKVVVYVFGIDTLAGNPSASWLPYVAGATILIASLVALRQDNLKRRLAYSTVSQLSYVVLAAAILTPLSAAGAAMHIAAHAVSKITLFFAAGSIYTAAHVTEISQMDGIGRRMPWTMGAFTVGALSLIGLPPFVGFVSKWFILDAAIGAGNSVAVVVLVASTLLNAAYFLPIVYAAFFRSPPAASQGGHDHGHAHGEAPLPIVIALTLTALATTGLFWWPDGALALAIAVGKG